MNFIEALKEMQDGKVVKCSYGFFKLCMDSGVVYSEDGVNWFSNSASFCSFKRDFEIYEEPRSEVKNGLLDSSGSFCIEIQALARYDDILCLYKLPLTTKKHVIEKWYSALATFIELKAHHLAVKAEDSSQLILRLNHNGEGILPESVTPLFYKIERISPCFDSLSDIRKAVKDIGEDRLIHMLKTFQGIYE